MKTAVAALLVAAAVLVQAAILNRLPLPWGLVPDLVLLVVVGVALWSAPTTAAATGFAAGLAADILPPADHEIGRQALLLCLAAFLVASIRDTGVRAGAGPYIAAALAALGVSLGYALLGLVLGDPRVGWATGAAAVLGGTAATALVSPLVLVPLGAVMRRLTGEAHSDLPAPWETARGLGR
ncbi:rod shape-determining protein MreD [Streptomonospora sp. S1-112]|uniref:Rod shape-determining protein MreD n=1 Tax=Streptomonospora mangrovi TaxID=2883123 RepID=A0A9X3NVF8_9ACTN|nr:rod shape-determining protein MreD [Streptomonospora mangrovi]MDA0564951.1 rod shape-determining protein MreD [Streptomonospora mangrovi]